MRKVLKFILSMVCFISKLILSPIMSLFKLVLLLLIILTALIYYCNSSITSAISSIKNVLLSTL